MDRMFWDNIASASIMFVITDIVIMFVFMFPPIHIMLHFCVACVNSDDLLIRLKG